MRRADQCVPSAPAVLSRQDGGQQSGCRHVTQLAGRLVTYSGGHSGPGPGRVCPGRSFWLTTFAYKRTGPTCESSYH